MYKSAELRIGCFICAILQLLFSAAVAQKKLTGNIKGNVEILSATATISAKPGENISDLGGNYRIPADPGDTIVFSHEGFFSDTVVVDSFMLGDRLPIELKIRISYLKSVDVNEMSGYSLDSLSRKRFMTSRHEGTKEIKLYSYNKLSGDGRGVEFSPIGHWSTNEKQKRELKERLERDDKEEFTYLHKFSRHVPKLTGLRGDSRDQVY